MAQNKRTQTTCCPLNRERPHDDCRNEANKGDEQAVAGARGGSAHPQGEGCGHGAHDRPDGRREEPQGRPREELRPEPSAPREEVDLPWPHDHLRSGDGRPLVRRVWAEFPADIYHLFLFSREADKVQVGELMEHERELHGPLGAPGGEAGLEPRVVERTVSVHVFADLDELDDQVCRDVVHRFLSEAARVHRRSVATGTAAFLAAAVPALLLASAAAAALALALTRAILPLP